MSINTASALGGIALQPDAKHPARYPDYAHGLTGGQPWSISRTLGEDAVTCGIRAGSAAYVESIDANPTLNTRLYPDVLGVYLLLLMGSCVSEPADDVGEGYYRHTFKVGPSQPYATIFGMLDMGYAKTDSCKLSQGEVSVEGTNPLGINLSFVGCEPHELSETPFAGVEPECFGDRFLAADCEMLIAPDSAQRTPALVSSLTVTVNNNCEGVRAMGTPWPSDVSTKKMQVGVNVSVNPDDFALYWRTYNDAHGRLSRQAIYGSLYAKFYCSEDHDITLEVEALKIPWNAEIPEANPEGGDGDVTFSTDNALIRGQADSPVTFTLVNKVESYQVPELPSPEAFKASTPDISGGNEQGKAYSDLVADDYSVTTDGTTVKVEGTVYQVKGWEVYGEALRNKWYPPITFAGKLGAVIETETIDGRIKRTTFDGDKLDLVFATAKGTQMRQVRIWEDAQASLPVVLDIDLSGVTYAGPKAAAAALRAKRSVTTTKKAAK